MEPLLFSKEKIYRCRERAREIKRKIWREAENVFAKDKNEDKGGETNKIVKQLKQR